MVSPESCPSYLKGFQKVMAAFGHWPDFHNAPVIALNYSAEQKVVEFKLHGSEPTRDLDEKGYHKHCKHHLVKFGFYEVFDACIPRFPCGNIVFYLRFSPSQDFAQTHQFRVDLESAMGAEFELSFRARRGEVLDVVPCDEIGLRCA